MDHCTTNSSETAIDMTRQTEAVQQQQSNQRDECAVKTSGSVDRVISRNKPSQSRQRVKSGHGTVTFKMSGVWKTAISPKSTLPCKYSTVSCLWKKGHFPFGSGCPFWKSTKVCFIQKGTVIAKGDPNVQFKIDTDHVFHEIFKEVKKPALQKVTKPLTWTGMLTTSVIGVSNMLLQKGDRHTLEKVYDVKKSAFGTMCHLIDWAQSTCNKKVMTKDLEALGLTWACERFHDFFTGQHFVKETNHKLSLLGGQKLNTLRPIGCGGIHCFQMRLMRYSFKICHVPGKSL
ncbi:Ferric/cupric reductase transmembrane component B [Labeo rohita]|uniref:Ferric/cupric reductase transmembrane component B n=1 Tax=Labeo rohita TaxID=84645 RepID=A0ABQ8L5G5_LABRO|nr:Ferric/cupric reductase transmembrane component B [Labeo rohita]